MLVRCQWTNGATPISTYRFAHRFNRRILHRQSVLIRVYQYQYLSTLNNTSVYLFTYLSSGQRESNGKTCKWSWDPLLALAKIRQRSKTSFKVSMKTSNLTINQLSRLTTAMFFSFIEINFSWAGMNASEVLFICLRNSYVFVVFY